jgi:hypothetical protein
MILCAVCFGTGEAASGALGWVLLLAGVVFAILTALAVTVYRIEKFRGAHGHH